MRSIFCGVISLLSQLEATVPTLDIIIPVKDRLVAACIASLQDSRDRIHQILICDGGSTQLAAPSPFVRVESYPMARFNKAVLLNQGILRSQADLLLISDADIIWNTDTLAILIQTLHEHPNGLCHIAHVAETNAQSQALRRQRYGYTLQRQGQEWWITVQLTDATSTLRPGCGLVCAYRQTFLKLGGYKECFQGWGWEDQDLLMRAGLMEIPILSVGKVLHQSHGDTIRNQFYDGWDPVESRDRNILTCLRSLEQGHLLGDLRTQLDVLPSAHLNVHVQFPDKLINRQFGASLP